MADHSPETAETPAGVVRGIIGILAFAAGFEGVVMLMHGDLLTGFAGIFACVVLSSLAYKWPAIHPRLVQRGLTISTNVAAMIWVAMVAALILGMAYSPLLTRPLVSSPSVPSTETGYEAQKSTLIAWLQSAQAERDQAKQQLATATVVTAPTALAEISHYSIPDKRRLQSVIVAIKQNIISAQPIPDRISDVRSLLSNSIGKNNLSDTTQSINNSLNSISDSSAVFESQTAEMKQRHGEFAIQIDYVVGDIRTVREVYETSQECIEQLQQWQKITNNTDKGMAGLLRLCAEMLAQRQTAMTNWLSDRAKNIDAIESLLPKDR